MNDKEFNKLIKILNKVTRKWKYLTRAFQINNSSNKSIPIKGFLSFGNLNNEMKRKLLQHLYYLQGDLDWLRGKLLPVNNNDDQNKSERKVFSDPVSLEEYMRSEDKTENYFE